MQGRESLFFVEYRQYFAASLVMFQKKYTKEKQEKKTPTKNILNNHTLSIKN